MSVYNFTGYLAQPRQSLGAELIGFNARTGQPVQAAAGGVGSYLDLTPEFYQTFQHESWQHPGSSGWTKAPVPGWGNNPNLQMFARRGVGSVDFGSPDTLLPVAGALLAYCLAQRSRVVAAVGGGVAGYALSAILKPKTPSTAPPAEPAPTEGLGWWGPWSKSWYTIWNGSRWLPARYTTSGYATDWLLDQKEANWNKTVRMYRHTGNGWVAAA